MTKTTRPLTPRTNKRKTKSRTQALLRSLQKLASGLKTLTSYWREREATKLYTNRLLKMFNFPNRQKAPKNLLTGLSQPVTLTPFLRQMQYFLTTYAHIVCAVEGRWLWFTVERKKTCQQPRSTPVEVKTTLSKEIFNGHRSSATALTAFISASIWKIKWGASVPSKHFNNRMGREPTDKFHCGSHLCVWGTNWWNVIGSMVHAKMVQTWVLKPDHWPRKA